MSIREGTLVATDSGYIPVEQLQPGYHVVYAADGSKIAIKSVERVELNHEYAVSFINGENLYFSEDTKLVTSPEANPVSIKTCNELEVYSLDNLPAKGAKVYISNNDTLFPLVYYKVKCSQPFMVKATNSTLYQI